MDAKDGASQTLLAWGRRQSQGRSFFWTKRKAKIDAKENKMLPRCEVSVILPVIEGEGERWERANAVESVARERKGREYLRERHRA